MKGKLLGVLWFFACSSSLAAEAGIEEFNRALVQATTRMDNAAALALWEDDGITLLPQTKPIIGKKAIAKFLDDVSSQLTGARMEKFEMRCFDIERSGDLATEWCEEHQHVLLPDGKPPFDGRGKMLLILHRGADGKWRMRREMWNEGVTDSSN
ncbi:MAG: nuclear transport factor 2 family protein [Steroidobacteraceae bacterium]